MDELDQLNDRKNCLYSEPWDDDEEEAIAYVCMHIGQPQYCPCDQWEPEGGWDE